jgi:hypothetical protein
MDNLLEKTHLVQFIILLLFYLLSNNISNNEDNILYKNSEYYLFLKTIVSYNKITEKYIKYIKKNQDLPINNNNILLNNNDYFYLYYNKYNIYIYFFKNKDSNIHNIYFNGINNKKDLNVLFNTLVRLLSNNFNFEYVNDLINKNGYLYKVLPNNISKIIFLENNILQKNTLIKSFEYIFNNEYENVSENNESNNEKNNKINLNINGFSLGGVLSQVFVHKILDIYKDKLNIKLFNIESWFGGNEEDFNKFKEKINVHNIYHKNSVFYIYNKVFQSYFNNSRKIECEDTYFENYKMNYFPYEIIKYINDYHFLSKIIK